MKQDNNKNNNDKTIKTYYRICIAMFATVIVLSVVLFIFNFVPMSKRSYRVICYDGFTRIEYDNGDIIEYPNTISELKSAISENSSDSSQSSAASEKININTASSKELQKLKGIGESKAAAIIQYREEHGGFKTIEEILRVDGIGEATFQKFRDMITV